MSKPKKGTKRDAKSAAANDTTEIGEDMSGTKAKPAVEAVMKKIKDAAAKAKKSKGIFESKEKLTIQARHALSDEEKAGMADKMVSRQNELIEREEEKKTVMAGYTEKIKVIKLDISKLSRGYRDGYEMRDFEVIVIYDYKNAEKQFKDHKTGVIVDKAPFSPEDYQRRFI